MMERVSAILFCLFLTYTGCQPKRDMQVLVFSKTEGYRHASIAAGKKALLSLGAEHGFLVDTTEDASIFTSRQLKKYATIIFLNTTGDCLDDFQQLEMMRYIQAGGGFVGIHAAADTEYDWPWYGRLVGAYFNGHPSDPNVREAEIERLDSIHLACQHLPKRWTRTDEWYNYRNIQEDLQVLLNLDETTYEGGTNGSEHPIAWYHDFDGGRAFYTGGGHTSEAFAEPDFVQHLWGGIKYAMGAGDELNYAQPSVAPEENRFQKIVLDEYLDEPMELAMLPDGRILFIERKGDIWLYDQVADSSRMITHLDVHTEFEDGLLGMALDPNFIENNWLYLFYSPPGDEPKQHLSRFTFVEDRVDLSSEKLLLEVGTQRDECCHSGGSVEFGPDGNLWFSTGDDTNPFASDGYSPSDERPGRSPWDAQKSSANTQDLRGKVCRITPQPDGSYTIPDGNLFPKDGSQGRPEIYVMGCRNPFRISIDARTGYLYWGDVGPDAGNDSIGRGPRGHDEVNQARQAGFYGWPYFVGDNKPYHEYDFARKVSLALYDPSRPVNNSPNNTGIEVLPPAQPAFIWYPYAESPEFPLVGTGGRNAMAGPVFYIDDYPENDARYPAYYDKKLFTYDWIRGWIMSVTMNEQGDFVSMERFLPGQKFNNPIDMIMSPAGDLYLLEYGTAWFRKNPDARLIHLKYIKGNRTPVAVASSSAQAGAVPFDVAFSSEGTDDPDGDALEYQWDFGDGNTSTESDPTHTFQSPGAYTVELTVSDRDGLVSKASVSVLAGNAPPALSWKIDGNKSFFWPGHSIDYSVEVSDEEDGTMGKGIDPENIVVTANYLEQGADINVISMGHQALAAASQFAAGKSLMEGSDCKACHFEDKESVGPAYVKVAQRYKGDEEAKPYLIDKVLNGGGGVWGDNAMAAHPQLSREDAAAIIDYILSLANRPDPEDQLPPQGTIAVEASQNNEEATYVLMASYTDKGAPDAAALTASEIVRLGYPRIYAGKYSTIEIATKFTPGEEQAAAMGVKPVPVVIGNHNGMVHYNDLDLTTVDAIALQWSMGDDNRGGSVDVFLDDSDGDPIATIDVPVNAHGRSITSFKLGDVSGSHDLILRFKGNDEAAIGTLLWIDFLRGDAL